MPEIAPVRTPSDATEMTQAFGQAWQDRFGEPVNPHVLALLLAHSDLETATWESMFHHNAGNIVVISDTPLFFHLKSNGVPTPHRYRVYDSIQDGADGMVAQLTSDTRPEWRTGLLTGSPHAFVRALSGANGGPAYFEADPERYLQGFLSRWDRYAVPDNSVARNRNSAAAGLTGIVLLSALVLAVRNSLKKG